MDIRAGAKSLITASSHTNHRLSPAQVRPVRHRVIEFDAALLGAEPIGTSSPLPDAAWCDKRSLRPYRPDDLRKLVRNGGDVVATSLLRAQRPALHLIRVRAGLRVAQEPPCAVDQQHPQVDVA